jgi:release factor glutamine methyltransferase
MTVARALDHGRALLARAGVPEPALDAELLLRHALGWDRARILAHPAEVLPAAAAAEFERLLVEREKRRPIQHLLGTAHFWRHEFLVSPKALIPRQETETLVEAALETLARIDAPVVVDVGTGSGCIAISLAVARPDAVVHAVDVSRDALELAGHNAARLGVAERLLFHEGDLLAPIDDSTRPHLVVGNPPYVDASEIAALAPEVRDHEPRLALVPADGDRYSVYRRLASAAARLLRPGGRLILEIGDGMRDEVERICSAAGLHVCGTRPDLRGILRACVAEKR